MLPSEQPATSPLESNEVYVNVEPRSRKFNCGVNSSPTKAAFQRRHSERPRTNCAYFALKKVFGESLHYLRADWFKDLILSLEPFFIAIDQIVLKFRCKSIGCTGIGG